MKCFVESNINWGSDMRTDRERAVRVLEEAKRNEALWVHVRTPILRGFKFKRKCLILLSLFASVWSGCSGQPYRVLTDREVLIEALIRVESRGDDAAVGDGGRAVGCLQLWPVYVRDANRIVRLTGGAERFSLKDRLSRERSIEMFNIVQSWYNPEGDVDKAIMLHNPRGGTEYYNKVKTVYDELKETSQPYDRGAEDTVRRAHSPWYVLRKFEVLR